MVVLGDVLSAQSGIEEDKDVSRVVEGEKKKAKVERQLLIFLYRTMAVHTEAVEIVNIPLSQPYIVNSSHVQYEVRVTGKDRFIAERL